MMPAFAVLIAVAERKKKTSSVKPFLILQVRALLPGWNAWCYSLSACLSSTSDKLSALKAFIHVAKCMVSLVIFLAGEFLETSWLLLDEIARFDWAFGPSWERWTGRGGVTCCDLTTHLPSWRPVLEWSWLVRCD
jgi:hypothetical protein